MILGGNTMGYKCMECGNVFEEGDQVIYKEPRGNFYEEIATCPKCGGAYEDAIQCDICGEYFLYDELKGGICESCMEIIE